MAAFCATETGYIDVGTKSQMVQRLTLRHNKFTFVRDQIKPHTDGRVDSQPVGYYDSV